MTFYPVTNGAQVRLIQSFRDQLVVNTLWFLHLTGAPTFADIQALATACNFQWQSSIATLLSNDLSYERCIVRDYSVENSFEAVASPSSPVPGTAGDAMPNNVAFAVSLRTGLSGRAYRGRIYLAGIPRAVVEENSLMSTFLDDVSIAMSGFIGPSEIVPDWQLGVAHRVSSGPPPERLPIPLDPGVITVASNFSFSDVIVDSQRRRLPGRGK